MRRIVTSTTSAAVLAATYVAPALAGSKNDDGEERGTTFTVTQSFLLFFVTPLAWIALTAVLVYAPKWIGKARAASRGGFLDDPTAADVQAPSRTAIGN